MSHVAVGQGCDYTVTGNAWVDGSFRSTSGLIQRLILKKTAPTEAGA